jgi:hypothetical protein
MGDLGKLNIEMFPSELIALNEETAKHPELGKLLAQQDNRDVYIMLCEIAAYCGVVLEGTYTREDVLAICDKLTMHLQKMRTIVIMPDLPSESNLNG